MTGTESRIGLPPSGLLTCVGTAVTLTGHVGALVQKPAHKRHTPLTHPCRACSALKRGLWSDGKEGGEWLACAQERPVSGGYRGRPPHITNRMAVMQVTWFVGRWLSHVRSIIRRNGWNALDGLQEHLRSQNLEDLTPFIRLVDKELRADAWNRSSSDGLTSSAVTVDVPYGWQRDNQWRAARRVVGHLLGLGGSTLRRRAREHGLR